MYVTQTQNGGLKLKASMRDTEAWARKPGGAWPCSRLATHRVIAEFGANGDLVDLDIDGGRDLDVPADELNAFASDAIRDAGFGNHPAVKA